MVDHKYYSQVSPCNVRAVVGIIEVLGVRPVNENNNFCGILQLTYMAYNL